MLTRFTSSAVAGLIIYYCQTVISSDGSVSAEASVSIRSVRTEMKNGGLLLSSSADVIRSGDDNSRRSLQTVVEPSSFQNENCPTECSFGQFCGLDSLCHPTKCDEVYKYGNPQFTRVDDDSEALTCVDLIPDEEDLKYLSGTSWSQCSVEVPIAFSHSCGSYHTCPPSGEDNNNTEEIPYVSFNRKCFARQTSEMYFECYDISPTTDLEAYLADYLTATAPKEGTLCNNSAFSFVNEEFSHKYIGTLGGIGIENNVEYISVDDLLINATVAFNMTAAMSTLSVASLRSLGSPFPDCREQGCAKTQFCGQDLKCHDFRCAEFYQHGPPALVGHSDGDSRGNLTCTTTDSVVAPSCNINGDATVPTAVQYTCIPAFSYSPPGMCPPGPFFGDTILDYVELNQVCTASPNEEQEFTCYEMDPETDFQSYFQDYIDFVDGSPSCPNVTTWSNETRVSTATHQTYTMVGNRNYRNSAWEHTGRSETFDPEEARYFIHSYLDGEKSVSGAHSTVCGTFAFVGITVTATLILLAGFVI